MRSFLPLVQSVFGDISSPLLILLLMILLWQPYEAFGFNIPQIRKAETPDFTEVSLFITENAKPGTVVGVLKQYLPYLKLGDDLRYQIYNLALIPDSEAQTVSSQSANESDHIFTMDSVSSAISVADSSKLDRERLCPFASATEKECSLNYGVSITRNNKSAPPLLPEQSWIKVKIVINDVNDCAPQFNDDNTKECKTIDLPEDTAVGTKIHLPDAKDLDSLQNGQLIYHLNCQSGPTNHPFALYQVRKSTPEAGDSNGISSIRLQLRYPLDHEERSAYNCSFTVCDSGTPILCSAMSLCITVHDVNDNAPVFLNENASIALREDTTVGSCITKLNATDADSGAFGSIRYALVGDMADSLSSQRHFRLDPNTGELFLISPLQGGTKFHFWVEARDRGEPESRMSRSTLSIYVIDVNNHSPKIIILPAASKIKNAVGKDASMLSVRSVLSRVTKVPCTFAGIKDSKLCEENDEGSSLIQIFEDNMAPTNVAFIHVSDADVGENAQVDCQLYTYPEIPFGETIKLVLEHQISSSKVVYKLVLELALDCEIHSHSKGRSICNSAWTIPVKIECSDFGSPVRKSFHNVFVEILDTNEFSPVFEKDVYRTEVKESAPVGSNILQVTVTDADSVLQGLPLSEQHSLRHFAPVHSEQTLRYELEKQANLPFAIDSHSGRIYTVGELDAENKTEYSFKVTAINTGVDNVTLTGTCQVIVEVQNVNDNPPHFLPPHVLVGNLAMEAKEETVIRIPENLHKGTIFMQLRTHDPDGSENSTIRLEGCVPQPTGRSLMVAPKQAQIKPVFEVDKRNGKCWTIDILDREIESTYVCTITAEDGEMSSRLTSTATMTIEITDENDNAPIWLYPRAPDDSRIQIGVEFPTARIITRVRAVDADSGKNARIVYSLEDASFVHFSHDRTCDLFALFSLESATGHLRMREGISPCIKPGDSAGSEVLNIPPESTFLTQADEAFGNKPLSSEMQTRESLVQTDAASSLITEEDSELAGTKRMYVFVLMIVVPVAAILLCFCLVTTLLFVIRSRRRRRPRRSGFKESCVLNDLDVLQAEIGTNRFSSVDACSGRTKSPTPSTSQMIYSADARTLSSQQRLRAGSGNDFVHTITGIRLDDTTSVHSGDIPPDGKVVYPIYLKPLVGEPTTSVPESDAVIRLTSIPELEGTILVPLPRHNLATPTVNYQQPISEAGILMACMIPDADKSSADSGKGQSDDDVFSHEGGQRQKCLQSTGVIYVPVGSTDVGQRAVRTNSPTTVSPHTGSALSTPTSTLISTTKPSVRPSNGSGPSDSKSPASS
ncbi:Protocadherin-11 X-linked [Taenia crassiceps]|uniref:Protocadherin-11 X-linked n=1 Tax=Taenia crassiceps TaxID=6207 RepID=A0ABR4QI77_9CEST